MRLAVSCIRPWSIGRCATSVTRVLASATAPGAVADAKQLVSDVAGKPIEHGLLRETAKRIAQARVGDEGQEGVRAFLERRKPSWAAQQS